MSWRDRFREDNEALLELIGGWRAKSYFIVAAITLLWQIRPRLLACEGALPCWATALKAAIWSIAWPFYWINYATDFVLLRPYG